MATELKFNQDDEKDTQQGAETLSGGPSSSPGGQTAPGGQRPSTPSGRPNIKQYLQANQGAGQKLEQGITGKVQNQANQFNTSLNNARQEFQTGSEPLKTNLGEQGSQKIQTAFKDPQALLNQQNQLQDFQKLRSGGYTQDIGQLQNAAQQKTQQLGTQAGQLQGTADLAGNEAGRFQLLRQTYGQPQYTRGQQKLDQLFLQAQPGSMSRDLRNIAGQAQAGVTGLSTEAQAQINALKGLSDARMQQWNNLLNQGATEGTDTDLQNMGLSDISDLSNQRLAQAQSDVQYGADLRNKLKNNTLSQQDLQRLGLSDLSGQSYYDLDLSSYINQANKQPTLAGTADPDQVARYRALRQLSGDTSGDLFGGEQQIGGFSPFDFNRTKLNQDLQASQKNFEVNKVNEIIDNMRNLGYFGGKSSGGGMRAADPGAGLRGQMGATFEQLRQQADSGQISPTDYYDRVMNAVNQNWGRSLTEGLYGDLSNYRNTLSQARSNVLGLRPIERTSDGQFDWQALSNSLENSGFTLPTNKTDEEDNLNYLAPKK